MLFFLVLMPCNWIWNHLYVRVLFGLCFTFLTLLFFSSLVLLAFFYRTIICRFSIDLIRLQLTPTLQCVWRSRMWFSSFCVNAFGWLKYIFYLWWSYYNVICIMIDSFWLGIVMTYHNVICISRKSYCISFFVWIINLDFVLLWTCWVLI